MGKDFASALGGTAFVAAEAEGTLGAEAAVVVVVDVVVGDEEGGAVGPAPPPPPVVKPLRSGARLAEAAGVRRVREQGLGRAAAPRPRDRRIAALATAPSIVVVTAPIIYYVCICMLL
jgi:hypothetical protein